MARLLKHDRPPKLAERARKAIIKTSKKPVVTLWGLQRVTAQVRESLNGATSIQLS